MRRTIKALLWVALILMLSSMATCLFGVRYAVSQIPPEVRAGMSDTDWVGVEWIARGAVLLAAALGSALTALALWLYRRRQDAKPRLAHKG